MFAKLLTKFHNIIMGLKGEPRAEVRKLILTNAAKEDLPEIVDVLREGWKAYADKSLGITEQDIGAIDFGSDKRMQEWREVIESNGEKGSIRVIREFLKDEKKFKIVGFSYTKKRPEKDSDELNSIYLRSSLQGEKWGNLLIQEVLTLFANGRPVSLMVFEHNPGAIAFYERLGFKKTGHTEEFTWGDGKKMCAVEMGREPQQKEADILRRMELMPDVISGEMKSLMKDK